MTRASVALLLTGCGIENTFLPPHQSDVFYQAPADQVDILFVVDDSGSMGEEQQALADGFQSFLAELEGSATAYRIAVISTSQDAADLSRGQLIGDPAILNTTTDTMRLFQRRVLLGTDGSDHEKGLQAAVAALEANPDFLRKGANLVVLFVSDEDDCSDAGRLDGQRGDECYRQRDQLTPVEALVDRMRKTKKAGETLRLGGILGPLDRSCPDAWSSERYVAAIGSTGGPMAKICDEDWTPTLQQLGAVAVGMVDEWVLSYPPDQTTLQVFVDELEIAMDPENGWTFEGDVNAVRFHGTGVPQRNTEVRVEYEVAGTTADL